MAIPSWLAPASGVKALGGYLGGSMGQSPQDAASPYYNKIPGMMKDAYQPYVDQGKESMGQYSEQLSNLLKDPASIMNMIGQGYKESPGYQHSVDSATQASMRAAAASGEAGAPSVQEALADKVSQLSSRDYNNYINQALGQYGMGMQGEQGLTNMGYGASQSLVENLANALMNQGNMAYSGAQGEQQGMQNLLGTLGQAGTMAMFL